MVVLSWGRVVGVVRIVVNFQAVVSIYPLTIDSLSTVTAQFLTAEIPDRKT